MIKSDPVDGLPGELDIKNADDCVEVARQSAKAMKGVDYHQLVQKIIQRKVLPVLHIFSFLLHLFLHQFQAFQKE